MTWRRTHTLLWLTLALAAPSSSAMAEPSPDGLDRAIKLFGSFDETEAELLLRNFLKSAPPAPRAAAAHIYLGLIALDALHTEAARSEFRQALSIDLTLEPPFDVSPKAKVLFAQARADLEREGAEKTGPFAPPPLVSPRPGLELSDAQRPSVLAPVIVSSGALALLGSGLIVGAIAQGTINGAPHSVDAGAAQAQLRTAGNQGLAADVLFGAAATAAVVATVLWIIDLAPHAGGDLGKGH